MARYFLHLRDSINEILDPEGLEFADLKAVRKAVLAGARDVMANDVLRVGVMDLRYRIDAENESGEVVHSMAFREAVDIILENGLSTPPAVR